MTKTVSPKPARSKTSARREESTLNGRAGAHQSTLNADSARILPLGFSSLPALLAFGALCLLLIFAPVQLSGFWVVDNDYVPHALLLGIAACVCLALALSPREVAPHSSPATPHAISFWLALFFGWSCLSLATSVYRHDSLLELSRLAGALVWFFIARRLLASSDQSTLGRRALWLVGAVVVGAVVVSLIALNSFRQEPTRQFATFFNPNLFANYCAMALPLSLSWLLLLRREAQAKLLPVSPTIATIAGLVAFVLVFGGLLVSYSKGGLLSSFIGVLVFMVALIVARGARLKQSLRAHRGMAIAAGLVFLVVAGALFGKTVLPRLQAARGSDEHSTMFRVYTWQSTLVMAEARPLLGWGAGSFPSAHGQFAVAGPTRSAHQSWLQIAAETGAPALLFLGITIGLAARRGWCALKDPKWPIAAGSLGALAALVAHGFTDAGWGIISIVLLFAIVLALLESAGFKVHSASCEDTQPATYNSQLHYGWLAATLIFAGASSLVQRAATAESLRAESMTLLRSGDARAIERAREATEADTLSARMWLHRAQISSDAQESILAAARATELQPTRAANWLRRAQIAARNHDVNTSKYFERALQLEPNETFIRLARAQWLSSRHDARAWNDWEFIARLRDEPYGRYPATPEIVNLDFARADAKLAESALSQKKSAHARELIARGLDDVARAKIFAKNQVAMAQALQQSGDMSIVIGPDRDLAQLEEQLHNLQRRLEAGR